MTSVDPRDFESLLSSLDRHKQLCANFKRIADAVVKLAIHPEGKKGLENSAETLTNHRNSLGKLVTSYKQDSKRLEEVNADMGRAYKYLAGCYEETIRGYQSMVTHINRFLVDLIDAPTLIEVTEGWVATLNSTETDLYIDKIKKIQRNQSKDVSEELDGRLEDILILIGNVRGQHPYRTTVSDILDELKDDVNYDDIEKLVKQGYAHWVRHGEVIQLTIRGRNYYEKDIE